MLCPHTSLTLGSPSCSAFITHKRLFQHEISSLISKRKPGSSTITSASLCYHLPRVCHLYTRTVCELFRRKVRISQDPNISPKNVSGEQNISVAGRQELVEHVCEFPWSYLKKRSGHWMLHLGRYAWTSQYRSRKVAYVNVRIIAASVSACYGW